MKKYGKPNEHQPILNDLKLVTETNERTGGGYPKETVHHHHHHHCHQQHRVLYSLPSISLHESQVKRPLVVL